MTPELQARARREADEMRSVFWGTSLPVDPVSIAKAMGIEVLDVNMPEGVDGAIRRREGEEATIYLERSSPPNRKRFTCAHELGHYADNRAAQVLQFVDYRDQNTNGSEQFANEFAGNLLMPFEEVEETLTRLGDKPSLTSIATEAQRFGVSLAAMQRRIERVRAQLSPQDG